MRVSNGLSTPLAIRTDHSFARTDVADGIIDDSKFMKQLLKTKQVDGLQIIDCVFH